MLYRGIKLTRDEVDTYRVGQNMHLRGYTSSSSNINVALKYALYQAQAWEIPVLFEIEFNGSQGLFAVSDEYGAFEGE